MNCSVGGDTGVANGVEGRWWLDFTRQPPRDPSGNEFVLSAGVVSIAKTGEPAGAYEIKPNTLEIALPFPSFDGEAPWRMVAQFLLPDPSNPPDKLPGMLQTFDSEERLFANNLCTLVRRSADA